MNSKPLVSIVTPSYNGEQYLDNYFRRILAQTYTNVELVLVNNGSTDNSDSVVDKYKDKIRERGFIFKYLHVDKNIGPLEGLNLGIKNITGEYFSEIDVDDSMHDDYIQKKVEFFLNNPDIDILITPVNGYNAGDMSRIIEKYWDVPFSSKEDLIDRYLLGKGVGYMGGAYMMKASSFFSTYKTHEIVNDPSIWGFATILYFPQLFLGEAAYLNEVLYDYFLYGTNLHITSEKRNLDILPKTYKLVMEKMGLDNNVQSEIQKKVTIYVTRAFLCIAFNNGDKKMFDEKYKELANVDALSKKDKIKKLLISNSLIYKCVQAIRGGLKK